MSPVHQPRDSAGRNAQTDVLEPTGGPAFAGLTAAAGLGTATAAVTGPARATPASVATSHDTTRPRSWGGVFMWMRILGAVGFVAGAAGGGVVANYYEFPDRQVALVAGLLGLFGASLGAIIPPLTRAIGWILLCAGIAAIGIGSLRVLGLLVPDFLERFLG